jgi:uroporphyrinogen-III decarboxylase
LDTLFEAADHTAKHISILLTNHMKLIHDFGTPCPFGAHTFAPFDLIGDTLRCTTGVMLDMYRQPEKLITACEALVPVSIKMAVQAAMVTRIPFVIIPLHKGDDAFMSDEQFIEFYWPTLKAQLLGLIDAGLIPVPFAEGYYDRRLDIIANSGLPKGKTVWLFDMTDMKTAKEKLGHMACIGGNVPAPLFSYASSPQKMDAYCKKLIEIAGPGGGFILSPGVTVFQAKPENMHAFFKSTKKYGVY